MVVMHYDLTPIIYLRDQILNEEHLYSIFTLAGV